MGSKKDWLEKKFESKKFGSEIFWVKKIWVGNFLGHKNLGRKFFWVKKIWVGNLVWVKKIWLGNFLGQKNLARKFFWVKKNGVGIFFGRKVLAKFYFRLLRFVWTQLNFSKHYYKTTLLI